MDEDDVKFLARHNESCTVVKLAVDGVVIGYLALRDEIRAGSRELIRHLNYKRLKVHLCTGDAAGPAMRIATQMGIPHIADNMRPMDKADQRS